jgi:Proteasomal ATPase OB C-terminal domain
MGKNKVLVKVHPEGKYVVDLDKEIDITKVTTGARVALRNDSYTLHLLLPTKVDPLVSLMKVEKVPDSTYDMIGGLDQQIKEIKEVRRCPRLDCNICTSLGRGSRVLAYLPGAQLGPALTYAVTGALQPFLLITDGAWYRSSSCRSSTRSCSRPWVSHSQRWARVCSATCACCRPCSFVCPSLFH